MIHAEYVEFDKPTGARVRRLEFSAMQTMRPEGRTSCARVHPC